MAVVALRESSFKNHIFFCSGHIGQTSMQNADHYIPVHYAKLLHNTEAKQSRCDNIYTQSSVWLLHFQFGQATWH